MLKAELLLFLKTLYISSHILALYFNIMNNTSFDSLLLLIGVVASGYLINQYHKMIYNNLSEQSDRLERDRNYWRAVASELYEDEKFLQSGGSSVDDL